MLYGYARVSSKEQSLERQKKILIERGVPKENIFEESASGKSFKDRIVYNRMLKNCKVGDVIYFTSLDRFSRNVNEAMKELEQLENRGLKAVFLREQISTEMAGVARMLLGVFSWMAENERLTLLERQKQGYKALKRDEKGRMLSKKGTPIGAREKILTTQQQKLIEDYKNGKSIYNITQIAKLLEVSRPFIYKKLRELETN